MTLFMYYSKFTRHVWEEMVKCNVIQDDTALGTVNRLLLADAFKLSGYDL